MEEKVIIIGGGIAGLTAGYLLTRRKIKVVILEKEPRLGGLASSFSVNQHLIERHYHFICRPDRELIGLVEELGLKEELLWTCTKMSFYVQRKIYSFTTPWDLLTFKPLDLKSRLRLGWNVVWNKKIKDLDQIASLTASSWLKKQLGRRGYQVIWENLLKLKFGSYYDQISAAWVGARIKRLGNSRDKLMREKLGYLKKGTQSLIDRLRARIESEGGEICCSREVEKIIIEKNQVKGVKCKREETFISCSQVISTVPLPVFLHLAADLPDSFRKKLGKIDFIGVVEAFFLLSQPLTANFWLNINTAKIPFAGIIEYTNLNPRPELGRKTVVYVPQYLAMDHPRYSMEEEDLYNDCLSCFREINPSFTEKWVEGFYVFRDKYAQPICDTNYLKNKPPFKTPVEALYLTDSSQLHPDDRTVSNSIKLGKKVVKCVEEDISKRSC
jgi:protoporphyrinogen oxidase